MSTTSPHSTRCGRAPKEKTRDALDSQGRTGDCREKAGFESLPDKTAIGTAFGLLDVLSIHPPPFADWTDNGTEFKGAFGSRARRTIARRAVSADATGGLWRWQKARRRSKTATRRHIWIEKRGRRAHDTRCRLERRYSATRTGGGPTWTVDRPLYEQPLD